ncbi:MAG: hypothetical protein ABJA02_04935 [Acidobacteriota bacterium]
MSSFKTSKDKDGKQEASTFKAGDTIYANAVISNAGGKTTTRFYLVADADSVAAKKGETVKGSEVKVDLPSAGTAQYSLPIPAGIPSGKFTLNAEMLDDKGEKKDSKSADITIEGSAAPAAKTTSDTSDDKSKSSDKDKDDDN